MRRTGFTPNAELINGRIAMTAITITSIFSLYDGSLYGDVLEGQLPQFQQLGGLLGPELNQVASALGLG